MHARSCTGELLLLLLLLLLLDGAQNVHIQTSHTHLELMSNTGTRVQGA